MDRLPHTTFFALPTHGEGSHTDELIDELESALRAVAALPPDASPIVTVARKALAEIQRLSVAPALSEVTDYVSRVLNIRPDILLSRVRDQRVTFGRQLTMYCCRSLTRLSFPKIGIHFQRDHSTVVHACNVIARRMRTDAQFRLNVHNIERHFTRPNAELAAAA